MDLSQVDLPNNPSEQYGNDSTVPSYVTETKKERNLNTRQYDLVMGYYNQKKFYDLEGDAINAG